MTTAVSSETWAYEDYVPFATIARLLQTPAKLCNEEYKNVIPSFELGRDGPIITSVFMITEHYLSEVRLKDSEDFDFVLLRSIANYRVELGSHQMTGESDNSNSEEQAEQPAAKTVFQTAKIRLIHNVSPNFASEISYVGHERDAWLERVFNALPLTLLSKTGS